MTLWDGLFLFMTSMLIGKTSACCTGTNQHSCRPCARQQCRPPQISTNITSDGLTVTCTDSICACVVDELDSCTYGGTWSGLTQFKWDDARWHHCIRITHTDPFQASATIRWWDDNNKCMGHSLLNIDIQLKTVRRNVYVDFEQSVWHTAHFQNDFFVKATSGCEECDRPIVGESVMYFEVALDPTVPGTQVQLRNCSVQTRAGKNGEVLSVFPIRTEGIQANGELNANKTRLTYTPFWDDITNSPFQEIQCDWAILNGTTGSSERAYMIADPKEKGILIHPN